MKLMGLILVCFCPVYIGMHFSSAAKKEYLELEGFIALVREIRYAVSFSMTKQADIFAAFTHPILEKNGFLPLLRSLPAGGGESLLTRALDASSPRLYLDAESKKILRNFALNLGKVSLEQQSADCDLCISRLEALATEKRTALPARQKLCRSLGLLVGGCALLILI